MDAREALKIALSTNPLMHGVKQGKDKVDYIYAIVNALRKQVSKKPTGLYEECGDTYWNCPCCGYQHSDYINGESWLFQHCTQCGQAIDWSEVK